MYTKYIKSFIRFLGKKPPLYIIIIAFLQKKKKTVLKLNLFLLPFRFFRKKCPKNIQSPFFS